MDAGLVEGSVERRRSIRKLETEFLGTIFQAKGNVFRV